VSSTSIEQLRQQAVPHSLQPVTGEGRSSVIPQSQLAGMALLLYCRSKGAPERIVAIPSSEPAQVRQYVADSRWIAHLAQHVAPHSMQPS
jgi:hypothetical protein